MNTRGVLRGQIAQDRLRELAGCARAWGRGLLWRWFDGTDNPLVEVPAARELQRAIGTWAVGGPPSPVPLRVLGAFGFDGTL